MQVDAFDTSAPDLLLVGGGLANGLLALRLSQLRPDLDVRIVEAAQTLGGVHTWSFFDSDLTPAQRDWMEAQRVVYAMRPHRIAQCRSSNLLRRRAFQIATSTRFDMAVLSIVVLNAGVMMLEWCARLAA